MSSFVLLPRLLASFLLLLAVEVPMAAMAVTATESVVATFDDNSLLPNSYWNGSNGSGKFSSNGVEFLNSYTDWGQGSYSWNGWAYSNGTNTKDSAVVLDSSSGTTAVKFYADRQYSASTGRGVNGSTNYAIGYEDFYPGPTPPVIKLPQATSLSGVYFTNTTYDYLSMAYGDAFGGKKFGGPTGNDPDWFKLTITGSDSAGHATGSVDFYLADFRNPDDPYIINHWTWRNLSRLGTNVRTLGFRLASSDTGSFGFYTPSYFAIDDFTFTAPVTWSGSASLAWSDSANWGGTALTGSQAIAFSGSNQTTSVNDLPTGIQLSSLLFTPSAAAFTLSGSGIRLAGNLTNSSTSTQTIDLGIEIASGGGAIETTAGNISIAGNIIGSGPLTKTGAGTLILSGTNNYSGGTKVMEGTLELLGSSALPDGSALTVGSGATLIFAGGASAAPVASSANVTAVPEPGTLGPLAAGLVGFVAVRFLRRKRVE